MAKYKSGIHTRLQLIIDKTGGYDPVYHAHTLSKELNIPTEDAMRLILLTENRDKLNVYIKWVKEKKYTVDDIVKMNGIAMTNSFITLQAALAGISSSWKNWEGLKW